MSSLFIVKWQQQGCLCDPLVPQLDSRHQGQVHRGLHRSDCSGCGYRGHALLQEEATEEENIAEDGRNVQKTGHHHSLRSQHCIRILCHVGETT